MLQLRVASPSKGGEVTKPGPAEFKWRQFEPQVILMAVGRYLRFSLSYRDVEELVRERGLSVDHVTVCGVCPANSLSRLNLQASQAGKQVRAILLPSVGGIAAKPKKWVLPVWKHRSDS